MVANPGYKSDSARLSSTQPKSWSTHTPAGYKRHPQPGSGHTPSVPREKACPPPAESAGKLSHAHTKEPRAQPRYTTTRLRSCSLVHGRAVHRPRHRSTNPRPQVAQEKVHSTANKPSNRSQTTKYQLNGEKNFAQPQAVHFTSQGTDQLTPVHKVDRQKVHSVASKAPIHYQTTKPQPRRGGLSPARDASRTQTRPAPAINDSSQPHNRSDQSPRRQHASPPGQRGSTTSPPLRPRHGSNARKAQLLAQPVRIDTTRQTT